MLTCCLLFFDMLRCRRWWIFATQCGRFEECVCFKYVMFLVKSVLFAIQSFRVLVSASPTIPVSLGTTLPPRVARRALGGILQVWASSEANHLQQEPRRGGVCKVCRSRFCSGVLPCHARTILWGATIICRLLGRGYRL